MKRLLWFVGLFIQTAVLSFAQNAEPIVMTVNGRPVYRTEFEISYKKNADLALGKNLSIKDFLQIYTDYQLALEEAYAQKMDTISNYRYQRSVYRSSIAAEYMQEKAEGYERCVDNIVNFLDEDVELNHVLIPFESAKVLPSDTLMCYKKAAAERARLLENGFKGDFYVDNTKSRDAVRDFSRLKGYIGWVAPGVFPPAVDKAIYSLPVGEISYPIRTSRGYHIVQVLNRRPAEGARRVDHVYFAFSQIPPTEAEVDSVVGVVDKLLASPSVNFDVLCRSFSEAYKTGEKGCSFAPFGLNANLPASFISEAYKLESKGEVSRPVISNTGVHLMRLVEKIPLSNEGARSAAEKIIASKGWMYYILKENHRKLFDKYRLKVDEGAYNEIEKIAAEVFPTDSMFVSLIKNKDENLFLIEDSVAVSVGIFVGFLEGKVEKKEKDSYEKAMERFFGDMPGDPFVLSSEKLDWLFSQFALQVLRNHVYETLEQRYPEMKSRVDALVGELLVYNVKEKEIYSKVADQKVLIGFFEQNKEKYKWEKPRFKGAKLVCQDKDSYNRLKTIIDSALDYKGIEELVFKEIEKGNVKSAPDMVLSVWEEGDDEYIDKAIYQGKGQRGDDLIILKGCLLSAPEEVSDVRAEVQADYLESLEKEWIGLLKGKYKVEVNDRNLKDLK